MALALALPVILLGTFLSLLIILLTIFLYKVVLSSKGSQRRVRFQGEPLVTNMEEGGTDYGSSKGGKGARWLKDLLSKKGESDNNAAPELLGVVEEAVSSNRNKLTDIKEEDEKENPIINGHGSKGMSEDSEKEEKDTEKGDDLKVSNEHLDQEEEDLDAAAAAVEDEVAQNAANVKLEKEEEQAKLQEGLMTYMAKTEMDDKDASFTGVMRVLGRFMKKTSPKPEAAVEPPPYSEVVQENLESELSKETLPEEPTVAKETKEMSTQVDEADMLPTDLEPAEDALPESERMERGDEDGEQDTSAPVSEEAPAQPEPTFRLRFQRFFADK